MEGTWVYLVSVWLVAASASEEYASYAVGKHPSYGPVKESYEPETYNRRCGIVPNVFQWERAERSDTEFGEYPWQVAILNGYDKDSFVCSGALVSRSDVLTSATCVKALPESYLRVRLGEWDIATDKNPKEAYKNLELAVVKKTIHPGYSSKDYYTPAVYDVALLKLEYPIDFSQYPQIAPVCLPSHEVDLEYAECFVAGWSESELNRIKVTQFVSQLVDVDLINAHKSYVKQQHAPQTYPGKPDYKPIDHNTVAKYSDYGRLPEYKSKDYKKPSYETKIELAQAASIFYNLTSVPLVTDINSRTLDDAQVLLEEKYECEEHLRVNLQIDQLCMSGINGYDVCKADLGSPVTCVVADSPSYYSRYRRDVDGAPKPSFTAGPGSPRDAANARMVVVGVASLVYPCNSYKETSAVVTDVVKSLEFILKNIDDEDYDDHYPY